MAGGIRMRLVVVECGPNQVLLAAGDDVCAGR